MSLSLQEKKRIRWESSRGFDSLELAGGSLRRTQAELIISHRKLQQTKKLTLILENRDNRGQSISFASRQFVLCGLPVRRLPQRTLLYERQNGRLRVRDGTQGRAIR